MSMLSSFLKVDKNLLLKLRINLNTKDLSMNKNNKLLIKPKNAGSINMTRTTNAHIEEMLKMVNRDMPNEYFLVVSQRYGHKAIDLMQGESSAIIKTMTAGLRSGEAYEWLNTYHKGLMMGICGY